MVNLPRNAFRGALAASAAIVAATAAAITLPASSALAADTATVNGATTYQTMAGFGASEAFGQASTVMNSSVVGAAAGAERPVTARPAAPA